MSNRKITKKAYQFLENESTHWQDTGLITPEQKQAILKTYFPHATLHFVNVVLTIGATLIGLGIILSIASNWYQWHPFTRLALLAGGYLVINGVGFALQNAYPRTGRSLIYIGVFVFGAAIFLLGEAFALPLTRTHGLLLWVLGVLPAALIFKDSLLLIFAQLVTVVYILSRGDHSLVWYVYPLIIGFYYAVRYFKWSPAIIAVAHLNLVAAIFQVAASLNLKALLILFVYVMLGLFLYYAPLKKYRNIHQVFGITTLSISGLFLTIPGVWSDMFVQMAMQKEVLSSMWALLLGGYLLWLTRKESMLSLVFLCILIFRYYVDTAYNFMPRSLFFISCGLILLAMGWFIERKRRARGGGSHE